MPVAAATSARAKRRVGDDVATVILRRHASAHAMRKDSLRTPAALIIAVHERWIARAGHVVTASPDAVRMLAALVASNGALITRAELTECLWGDDPDGGPDNARDRLNHLIMEVRTVATAFNVGVTTVKWQGWRARLLPARLP
jgi:DNA-binding response OmpR family regulator